MGTFEVTIEVADTEGSRLERMEALVGTSAIYLAVPRDILASLGYRPMERRPFAMADNRIVEYDVGVVSLKLDGRTLPVVCVFVDEGSQPLLGAVALENFLLAAEPVNDTLVPVAGRLT